MLAKNCTRCSRILIHAISIVFSGNNVFSTNSNTHRFRYKYQQVKLYGTLLNRSFTYIKSKIIGQERKCSTVGKALTIFGRVSPVAHFVYFKIVLLVTSTRAI
jgi:hypothetical protein